MIRSVSPVRPHPPQTGSKRNHWNQEKCAGNFKPQNSADPAKRTEKATHTFGDSAAASHAGQPGGLRRAFQLNWCISNGLRLGGGIGLRGVGKPLANHAASYANPNAQCPSDRLRFHSSYDGSSDTGCTVSRLPLSCTCPIPAMEVR